MDWKKGVAGAGAVLVAGILIAGQTLGWRTFLPSFSSAQISISPTSRPLSEAFFADEKLWVTLGGVETDRVYWVFDESDRVVAGGIQLQYTFPFNATAPVGGESKRRIDAFYKVGDEYKHTVKRVSVRNIQIRADSSFGPQGLAVTLPKEIPGEWKLDRVRLARLSKGGFKNAAIEPETSTASDTDARIVWNGAQVASEFGYRSSEEAGSKLISDGRVWISAEYKGNEMAETLTVVKPISTEDKP